MYKKTILINGVTTVEVMDNGKDFKIASDEPCIAITNKFSETEVNAVYLKVATFKEIVAHVFGNEETLKILYGKHKGEDNAS